MTGGKWKPGGSLDNEDSTPGGESPHARGVRLLSHWPGYQYLFTPQCHWLNLRPQMCSPGRHGGQHFKFIQENKMQSPKPNGALKLLRPSPGQNTSSGQCRHLSLTYIAFPSHVQGAALYCNAPGTTTIHEAVLLGGTKGRAMLAEILGNVSKKHEKPGLLQHTVFCSGRRPDL